MMALGDSFCGIDATAWRSTFAASAATSNPKIFLNASASDFVIGREGALSAAVAKPPV